MAGYAREFYEEQRREQRAYAADVVLSLLLAHSPPIRSAIDLGCGVGVWLSVLREKGVEEIQGVDGEWVDRDLLLIPEHCFRQVDLGRETVEPPQETRYDLAISLEVAEHLPPERAPGFVAMLTDLADRVLFSAALPRQGGQNHLNEQWPSYWADLFAARGYAAHDFIRPAIWNDDRIPVWYRQNIIFFSREDSFSGPESGPGRTGALPLDVVHPDHYLGKLNAKTSVRTSFRVFLGALKDYIRRKIGSGS